MRFLIFFLPIFLFSFQLEEFDASRLNVLEGKISLEIKTYKKNRTKERVYDVYRNENNSLIAFLHTSERGNVVLNYRDNLYIKTPRARAVRVTPIQRLSGDASIGDVLELEFAKSYEIEKSDKESLTLKAKSNKSTYSKVVLYLKNRKIVRGDLFSFSGKLLKKVEYIYNSEGKIGSFKFTTNRSYTTVEIKKLIPMKIPKRLFSKNTIGEAFRYANSL